MHDLCHSFLGVCAMQAPAELGHVLLGYVHTVAGDSLVSASPEALRAMRPKQLVASLRFLALTLTCALYSEELGDDEVLGSDAPSQLGEQSHCPRYQPLKSCPHIGLTKQPAASLRFLALTLTCALYSEELGDDEVLGSDASSHLGEQLMLHA